jgi:hypothetical protein
MIDQLKTVPNAIVSNDKLRGIQWARKKKNGPGSI